MVKRKKPQPTEATPPENPPPVVKQHVLTVAGLTPWTVFQAALKAVPALKYALGVMGIVSAVAIIKGFGIDFRGAVFGNIIMVILMAVLVIFAALTKAKGRARYDYQRIGHR